MYQDELLALKMSSPGPLFDAGFDVGYRAGQLIAAEHIDLMADMTSVDEGKDALERAAKDIRRSAEERDRVISQRSGHQDDKEPCAGVRALLERVKNLYPRRSVSAPGEADD